MENTQKTIIQIYVAFILAVVLNFVPSVTAQTLGALLLFVMVVAAYVYRFKSEKGTMMHSHMLYLIKSFWISSLFMAIGIVLSIQFADHSVIHNAVETVKGGVFLSEEQIENIIMEYTKQNLLVFCATLLPAIFYLVYRCVKGIILAKKHRVLDDLQSWF